MTLAVGTLYIDGMVASGCMQAAYYVCLLTSSCFRLMLQQWSWGALLDQRGLAFVLMLVQFAEKLWSLLRHGVQFAETRRKWYACLHAVGTRQRVLLRYLQAARCTAPFIWQQCDRLHQHHRRARTPMAVQVSLFCIGFVGGLPQPYSAEALHRQCRVYAQLECSREELSSMHRVHRKTPFGWHVAR